MADLRIAFSDSINSLSAEDWNTCVPTGYPFLQHGFLAALENSGSVGPVRGWQPRHVSVFRGDQRLAVMPMYGKQHSWGEYVFDQEWADAYRRFGRRYYPKWLTAVPFSPVTGPRLCLAPSTEPPSLEGRFQPVLFDSLRQALHQAGVSSWHLLFCDAHEADAWRAAGASVRLGCQFHWHNRVYRDFDDYLATFTARKRKSVKRERRQVAAQGIVCERRWASAMSATDWQQFYQFYALTYLKRGHQPHLNLAFFQQLAAALPDSVLVDWAYRAGQPVAAALFVVGSSTLYGRYWGSIEDVPGLHFEVCFYRGIEFCITQGLQRFDPGAQGEHKISRGFEPVRTYSCHWVDDPAFREAIDAFLQREQDYVEQYRQQAALLLPFRVADTDLESF